MTAANLAVNTSTGNPTNNVAADPAYDEHPTTTQPKNDLAQHTVILPVLGAQKRGALCARPRAVDR